MEENNADPERLTREACEVVGLDYDAGTMYQNPTKHVKFGMSYNWHNNLVPDDVMTLIAEADTVAEGIAEAADLTLDNWANHRYSEGVDKSREAMEEYFIGVIQELAYRDGKGAVGEAAARGWVSGRILPRQDDDEDNGIDLRTTEATYQVKTGETFKSSWDKKEADVLLWIETEGDEVVQIHER